MSELEKMNAWLVSNPKKRKKDYPRFINNWLSRAHGNLKAQSDSQYDLDKEFETI